IGMLIPAFFNFQRGINKMNAYKSLLLLLLISFMISCSTSRNPNINRGSGYNFKSGYPEFRTSAYGFIEQDEGATLQIGAEIIKGSLIYKSEEDSLRAQLNIQYQIQDLDDSKNVIVSEQERRTVNSTDPNISNSRKTVDLQYTHHIDPGH